MEETVRVAHSNFARVKELVEARPALARAAVDWGFGDWEDALGAASHTGRYEIAELLIAHGARPTLFSAAMMGQLDVVKAFIAAAPGSQAILGPHNLTLLTHAKAGGERARPVREFLEQIGGADPRPEGFALAEADRAKYAGTYVFGAAPDEVLIVANEATGLTIARPGLPFARGLAPVAQDTFAPTGARAVRVRFTFHEDGSADVGVFDPELVVKASRRKQS
ncbi:MAG TPA: hypothetical protein VIP11_15325 [Gemmatimonadaceae bacterium]